jgi:hypothetical protein
MEKPSQQAFACTKTAFRVIAHKNGSECASTSVGSDKVGAWACPTRVTNKPSRRVGFSVRFFHPVEEVDCPRGRRDAALLNSRLSCFCGPHKKSVGRQRETDLASAAPPGAPRCAVLPRRRLKASHGSRNQARQRPGPSHARSTNR